MPIRILAAGCSDDERQVVEPLVRAALGQRGLQGSWTVSLVKIQNRWSVTVDGPPNTLRAWSFVGARHELADAIAGAVAGTPARGGGLEPRSTAPRPGPSRTGGAARSAPSHTHSPGSTGKTERRERVDCEKCRAAFVVVYESRPGEPQRSVGVACPHCWTVNRHEVAEDAAMVGDYRAEKA